MSQGSNGAEFATLHRKAPIICERDKCTGWVHLGLAVHKQSGIGQRKQKFVIPPGASLSPSAYPFNKKEKATAMQGNGRGDRHDKGENNHNKAKARLAAAEAHNAILRKKLEESKLDVPPPDPPMKTELGLPPRL